MSCGRTLALFLAIAAAWLPGCATNSEMVRKYGPNQSEILANELAGWDRWIKIERLDAGVRPIAVRRLQCRYYSAFKRTFSCDYLVDYGTEGAISGTLGRRYRTFERDESGRLEEVIIVT